MRILVADDDAVSRTSLQHLLKKWRYEVVVAKDGNEAWQALQTNDPPRLAVLDWIMPGFDGLELVSKIRATRDLQATYVILLSARTERDDMLQGLTAGADDYLTKPLDAGELQVRVQVGMRIVQLQSILSRRIFELQSALTARQRAELALVKEQYYLHCLMDSLPAAIYFKDGSSRFTRINKAQAKHLGLADPHDAVGKSDHDFFSEEHAAQAFADEQQVMQTGNAIIEKEEKETWPDGSITWAASSKMPLLEPDGKIAGTFGISRDITEQKQTQDAKGFLASIVEASDDAIIGVNLDGTIASWNRGAEALYGYAADEITGKSVSILLPPDRPDELAQILEELKQGERIVHFETKRVGKDGRPIDVSLTYSPMRNSGGEVTGAAAVVRDITERKRAEAEKARLVTAIEQTAEGIVITDAEARIQYVNPAFTKMTGYSAAEAIGQNPRVLKSADHPPDFYQDLWNTILSGQVWSGELTNRRKDGTTYPEEMTITPVRDSAGVISNFIAVKHDVTERRSAEETNRFLASIVEASDDAIVGISLDGRVASWNHGAESLYGYRAEEIIGKSDSLLISADRPGESSRILEAIKQGQRILPFETGRLRKDGRRVDISLIISPIKNASGEVSGAAAIGRDITERKQAQEAIRRREEKYQSLVANIPDVVWTATCDGQTAYISPKVEQVFGFTAEEVYEAGEDSWLGRIHPDDFPSVMQAFQALFAEGKGFDLEYRVQRKDGQWIWIRDRALTTYEKDGVCYADGIFSDITERKRAADALAEESRLAALQAEIGVALTRGSSLGAGLQGCCEALVRHTGAAFARIWTLNRANAMLELEASAGMYTHTNGAHGVVPVGKFKIGRIAEKQAAHLSNDVQNDPEVGDHEWARREGLVSFVGYPLTAEGQVVGVVAAFGREPWTDATLHAFSSIANQTAQFVHGKRAEEALRHSQERARLLFATIPHPAYVFAVGTLRFLEVNDMAVEHYGYSRDEFVRMKISDIRPVEEVARLKEHLQQAKPNDASGQWKHRTKDGRLIDVEINAQKLEYDGHQAYLVIAQDITERKRLEVELRHAQKLESVGGLASGIAHEINTPIQFVGDNVRFLQDAFSDLQRVIKKYQVLGESAKSGTVNIAVLEEASQAEQAADLEYLTEEVPRALSQSLEGVGRVATIVKAMKEFAHPDRKEKVAADLNKALQSTLIVARNELKYVAEVETDLGDIPPVECHIGDVNQVFLNLLVNATHAIDDVMKSSGEKGTIRVETRQDGEFVRISISDTGCGIPESIRAKIFDPFFTTKEVGRGTGQGLAIARSIVTEKHGGTLTFDSEAGRGTTFVIRLPIGAKTGLANT